MNVFWPFVLRVWVSIYFVITRYCQHIVGCVNCAYLGFYGCDCFTGFDLFAHVVIVSVNQHCYSWRLYYCVEIVGLFTSQVICLFLYSIFIWLCLYNMHLIIYDFASSNAVLVLLKIWDGNKIVNVIWFSGMGVGSSVGVGSNCPSR